MFKFIDLCCFFCFYFLLCMLLHVLFSRSLSSLIFSLITNCSKIVLIFPISPYFLLYSSLILFYFIFIGIILFCLHLYYFISSSLISFYFIFICIILFYLNLYHFILFCQRVSLLEFWQLDME